MSMMALEQATLSSSWSGDSLSKWISYPGHVEESSHHHRLQNSLLFEGSTELEWAAGSGRSRYTDTHFTYGQPDLSPTSLGFSFASQSISSPQSTGNVSPMSTPQSHSHQLSFWNHSVPSSALVSELNSPRPSPIHFDYPAHHASSTVNSPFIPAIQSPPAVTGSPIPPLASLVDYIPFHASAYRDAGSLSAYTESPREQYVNMSDVASSPPYQSPHTIPGQEILISDVDHALVPQEESPRSSGGRKRARASQSEGEDSVYPPLKRPRGRPRKKLIPSPPPAPVSYYDPSPVSPESEQNLAIEANSENLAFTESEEPEDDDDDDDSDLYVPSRSASPRVRQHRHGTRRMSNTFFSRTLSNPRIKPDGDALVLRRFEELAATTPFTGTENGFESYERNYKSKRQTPVVPVPNLVKKSRGRKVPVDEGVVDESFALVTASSPSTSTISFIDATGSAYENTHSFNEKVGGFEGELYRFPDELDQVQVVDNTTSASASASTDSGGLPTQGRPSKSGGSKADVKIVNGGIKKTSGDRRYVCTACGKCFVRGEHLKRHVRSLHTYEKPHKCPHPGCDKSFSRRDNLGQHTRVHL